MKKISRAKKLWKFVYSEIRCGRSVSIKDRDMLFYAKYADYMKFHIPRVRSLELKGLAEKQADRNFIKSLFKD